jgi:hypothetical protein
MEESPVVLRYQAIMTFAAKQIQNERLPFCAIRNTHDRRFGSVASGRGAGHVEKC